MSGRKQQNTRGPPDTPRPPPPRSQVATYTYATLEVSSATWIEIASLLTEAGYICINDKGEIDMHGIALVRGMK